MSNAGRWKGGYTRTSLVYFDYPTHLCESNCSEAADGTTADHDEFFCHGESGASFTGMMASIEKRSCSLDPHLAISHWHAYLRGPYYGMKKCSLRWCTVPDTRFLISTCARTGGNQSYFHFHMIREMPVMWKEESGLTGGSDILNVLLSVSHSH